MTTLIYGNGNNFSVSDDNSNGDTIFVSSGTSSISGYDMITLGNGAGGARLDIGQGMGQGRKNWGRGLADFEREWVW